MSSNLPLLLPERKALIRNFVQGIEIADNQAELTYTIPMPQDGITSESASVLNFVQSGPPVPALGVDSDKGTVHGMTTAAANMHEVAEGHNLLHGEETVVCGDADYQGVLKRKEH